jgi:hypothetical protein
MAYMQHPKLLGAAIVAGIMAVSAGTRAHEISYSEGPVWKMTFVKTEYGHERDYERYLARAQEQVQEEGDKQGPLPTDSIPLRLDGILCHALSVFTLLFSLMP